MSEYVDLRLRIDRDGADYFVTDTKVTSCSADQLTLDAISESWSREDTCAVLEALVQSSPPPPTTD